MDIAAFTFYTAAHASEWHVTHNLSKPWRTAGYLAVPAIVGTVHGYAAAHNAVDF